MRRELLTLSLVLLILTTACGGGGGGGGGGESSGSNPITADPTINELTVPPGFDYELTRTVDVNVQVRTFNGRPHKGVKVTLEDPETGAVYDQYVTDELGQIRATSKIPTRLDSIALRALVVGIVDYQAVTLNQSTLTVTFE